MARARPPVVVTAEPSEAAVLLRDLLEDYFATLDESGEVPRVEIVPIDDLRRGTVIYRVIQASRTVAERIPEATLFIVTEDGNRWRLPPPAL